MSVITTEEKKLAKWLKESEGIEWEDYLKRFDGTKPIEIWPTSLSPNRLRPEQVECEIELIGILSSKYFLKRFDREYKIVAGFKKKVNKAEVEKLPYISPSFLGLGKLLHRRIIDQMLELCADDFEPISVTLISQHKDAEPFEIKDFYALNVLKCIKAIDEERSDIIWREQGMSHIKKFLYKENPWQDGCNLLRNEPQDKLRHQLVHLDKPCMLAIDALSGAIVWHPKVAKLLPFHPMYWFIQDVEQK